MDQWVAFAILRPLRQARSVGITGLGEVAPVTHHLVAQLAVLGAPHRSRPRIQRGEDILDLVRVKRKRAGMELAWGRRQLEMIAVNRRLTRLAVGFQPLPGAEGDERVAGVVDRRTEGLVISISGIELEKLVCAVLEQGSRHSLELLSRHATGGKKAALIAIPAAKQRHMGLPSCGIGVG